MKIQDLNDSSEIDMSAVHGGCPLVDGGNVTVQEFADNAPRIASEYGPVALIGYASNVVIC